MELVPPWNQTMREPFTTKWFTMKGRYQSWKSLVYSCLNSRAYSWSLMIISWSSKDLIIQKHPSTWPVRIISSIYMTSCLSPFTIRRKLTFPFFMLTRSYRALCSPRLWQNFSPVRITRTPPTRIISLCSGIFNLDMLVSPQSIGLEGKVFWEIWERIWEAKTSIFPSFQLASMWSRK